MSYQSFSIPRKIIFDQGAISHLSEVDGNKAVIVTGGNSMKRTGYLDKCCQLLEENNIETKIVDGVEPNPSVQTVKEGANIMKKFQPDWIIAIGGGSALDAAKIMWVFYEKPNLEFTDVLDPNSIPSLRKKSQFIAIPSTSGTASEITAFSVITDTKEHIKYPIVSDEIVPDIAIVDPEIPASMPPHITANTGMDVLAHAVEAFVSSGANSYTDPLAKKAIKLVFEYLPKAYEDGDDMEARYNMHNASTIAGMAFSNSSLGLIHSLAHKIGGEFGVTHGLANAILLPYICKYNMEATDKFNVIEDMLDSDSFIDEIQTLNKKLNIPLKFKELKDIDEKDFYEVLDRMSENAYNDPCTLTNPRETSVQEVSDLYRSAYLGTF